MDAAMEAPVPFANVRMHGTQRGTACDSSGYFHLSLPPGSYRLVISALGYEPSVEEVRVSEKTVAVLNVSLTPAVIAFPDEIVVYGRNRGDAESGWLNATEDVIRNVAGISMIRRANFALEPTIRGMDAGRIGVVIDGMKIFGACVDRMDPVTAYVEVENLEKLEVSKNSLDLTKAANIGGTLNMVTHKADFTRPFLAQSEIGYETVSGLRRYRGIVNYADSLIALRATVSLKKSGDFRAGGGQVITGSGFAKNNYKMDMSLNLGAGQRMEFSFIGDNASNIGYPVLLMDATTTKSQIYRLEHHWMNPFRGVKSFRSMVYFNRIDHWMDDYDRDVTVRPVMRNMYMPMFGKTRTAGVNEEISLVTGGHRLNLILDFYRLTAFADMKMVSVLPGVSDAYLLNLGDVLLYNTAAVVDYSRLLTDRLRLRTNLRIDYSDRDLRNEFGRRQLEAFWETGDMRQTLTSFSFSSAIEYRIGDYGAVQLVVARSERIPSHIENYGFFLYNVTDGYFYTGNPLLKPETSYQAELSMDYSRPEHDFRINVYYNNIRNYISGVIQSEEFKTFANITSAFITGVEVKGSMDVARGLRMYVSAAYTYGQNRELNEPLPLIPPLEGGLGIQWSSDRFRFAIESRFASAQNRIASRTTLEDRTAGFILLNLRGRFRAWDFLDIKLGVENLLDHYYNEHLSVNNLPGRGRNAYFGLNVHSVE